MSKHSGTRRLKRVAVRLAILLSILIFSGGRQFVTAASPTPISSCGTVSGNVILTQDISTTNSDCLVVSGADTTIDGNGKTVIINDAGHAVSDLNQAHLTVRNLTSNSDLYLDGDNADFALIESNHVGGVVIIAADDVTIRNNILNTATLGQLGTDAQRITFTGNTVRSAAEKLVTIQGSGIVPCPPSQHVISNNTFTSDHVCTSGVDCNTPTTLFISCSSNSTYANNTITATSKSQGLTLQDESDSNTFSRNTVWVHDPDNSFGALNFTSNHANNHSPRLNVFSNNFFRSDADLALNMQSPGDGNAFDHNVFWANSNGYGNLMNGGSNGNGWDHNTFVNIGTGPTLFFNYPNNSPADSFTNNIISTAGSSAVQVAGGSGWSFSRYTGDHNLFWSENAASTFSSIGSLAAWKTQAAPDDGNSRFDDPAFTNPMTGIFTLQQASPARAMGTNGSDVGAFAYFDGPPTCVEKWSCGPWSVCVAGEQERTCTDARTCGTTVDRPVLTQDCIMPAGQDSTPPATIISLRAL